MKGRTEEEESEFTSFSFEKESKLNEDVTLVNVPIQ